MVDLLDDARLITQLVGLERRTAPGDRDSIDHAPGAHGDVANAAAGVVSVLASRNDEYASMDWVCGPDRRSKSRSLDPSTSDGGNSDKPSLRNLTMRHSTDCIFDGVSNCD
jgi:hypothetical protein